MDALKRSILNTLTQTIRGLERHGLEVSNRPCISSGYPELDDVLPRRGLPMGALIELLAEPGAGALTLALCLGRGAMERGAAWAVVDPEHTFYPPAAAQLGLDLSRLILVRPSPRHTHWCFTQLLRCAEIGASFICLRNADNMVYRRFQLAAERGGGQGFIVRPALARRKPCWAALRLGVGEAFAGENALKLTIHGTRVAMLHGCG